MKLTYSILAALTALAPAACDRDRSTATQEGATPAPAPAAAETSTEPAKPGFGELTVDQVAERIGKPGVHLFDNNGRDEWEAGHVPTATWVDYKNVSAKDLPADKSAQLIFYCHNEH